MERTGGFCSSLGWAVEASPTLAASEPEIFTLDGEILFRSRTYLSFSVTVCHFTKIHYLHLRNAISNLSEQCGQERKYTCHLSGIYHPNYQPENCAHYALYIKR